MYRIFNKKTALWYDKNDKQFSIWGTNYRSCESVMRVYDRLVKELSPTESVTFFIWDSKNNSLWS